MMKSGGMQDGSSLVKTADRNLSRVESARASLLCGLTLGLTGFACQSAPPEMHPAPSLTPTNSASSEAATLDVQPRQVHSPDASRPTATSNEVPAFDPGAPLEKAGALRRQGKPDEAERILKPVLTRHPSHRGVRKALAFVYLDQDRVSLARGVLSDLVDEVDPVPTQDADLYLGLGWADLKDGQQGRAMVQFEQAVGLDGTLTAAQLNIGALAVAFRDYPRARTAFEAALAQAPGHPQAELGLGYALEGLGESQAAVAALERAVASGVGPNSPSGLSPEQRFDALRQIAVIWQNAEEADKALASAERYLEARSLRCAKDDLKGFCSRYHGIRLMADLKRKQEASNGGKGP
jgi:tetratricopeptide (TPR) repeat protein